VAKAKASGRRVKRRMGGIGNWLTFLDIVRTSQFEQVMALGRLLPGLRDAA
jgi:hypothetical protein